MQINYNELYLKPSRLKRYKIWLQEVCEYYEVKEEEVLGRRILKSEAVAARHTFYWLCWKDRINLYRLSEHIGKNRSTISATMSQGLNKRNKEAENFIYEKISLKEREESSQKKITSS